jgi:hypothetical protein
VLLLKIDVEGYEDFVFKVRRADDLLIAKGMTELLHNFEVKNIICETKKTGDVEYKRKVINGKCCGDRQLTVQIFWKTAIMCTVTPNTIFIWSRATLCRWQQTFRSQL